MRSTPVPADNTALLRTVARIERLPHALQLYFPPWRNLGAAVGFSAFGALSVALPLAAMVGIGLADGPATSGWMAIILVGGFALPVMAFGIVFLALAAYLVGNSLTVSVGPDQIAVTRRLFGLTVSRRSLPRAEISAVQPQAPRHLQNQFSTRPYYRLVARGREPGNTVVVVAESLPGRPAVEQMGALIADATGIGIEED